MRSAKFFKVRDYCILLLGNWCGKWRLRNASGSGWGIFAEVAASENMPVMRKRFLSDAVGGSDKRSTIARIRGMVTSSRPSRKDF